ncbi:MAG: DUF998 domain-containing protein [Aestuariivirga sp.]
MSTLAPLFASAPLAVPAAWTAIAATGLSAATLLALHWLSPELAPSWRMVSEYANGQHGAVLTVMFLAWALSAFALVIALWPLGAGWLGLIGLFFLILAGVGEAMGGLFDINHKLHGLAFGIGVPTFVIAAILLTFAGRAAGLTIPLWSGFLPLLSVVAMAAAMMMMFSGLKAAGITMTADSGPLAALPDGMVAWSGWANRLVFAAYYLWVLLAARAVLTAAG